MNSVIQSEYKSVSAIASYDCKLNCEATTECMWPYNNIMYLVSGLSDFDVSQSHVCCDIMALLQAASSEFGEKKQSNRPGLPFHVTRRKQENTYYICYTYNWNQVLPAVPSAWVLNAGRDGH